MGDVSSAIRNTVSISLFNKGRAGQIFEEVKRFGAKVVMKNNTAECVLVSPEEYLKLVDLANETELLTMAIERMEHIDAASLISDADLCASFGITDEDLEGYEEVEIE